MAETVMLALPLRNERMPDGWLTEANYRTEFEYRNRGLMNRCEVTVRWHFDKGATLDVVAFERMLAGVLDRETTVEDLARTVASAVNVACNAWFYVQLVANVPGAPSKLVVILKKGG